MVLRKFINVGNFSFEVEVSELIRKEEKTTFPVIKIYRKHNTIQVEEREEIHKFYFTNKDIEIENSVLKAKDNSPETLRKGFEYIGKESKDFCLRYERFFTHNVTYVLRINGWKHSSWFWSKYDKSKYTSNLYKEELINGKQMLFEINFGVFGPMISLIDYRSGVFDSIKIEIVDPLGIRNEEIIQQNEANPKPNFIIPYISSSILIWCDFKGGNPYITASNSFSKMYEYPQRELDLFIYYINDCVDTLKNRYINREKEKQNRPNDIAKSFGFEKG